MNDNIYTLEQQSHQIQRDWLAGAENARQVRLVRITRAVRRAAKAVTTKRSSV